jgi:hypothetical protein
LGISCVAKCRPYQSLPHDLIYTLSRTRPHIHKCHIKSVSISLTRPHPTRPPLSTRTFCVLHILAKLCTSCVLCRPSCKHKQHTGILHTIQNIVNVSLQCSPHLASFDIVTVNWRGVSPGRRACIEFAYVSRPYSSSPVLLAPVDALSTAHVWDDNFVDTCRSRIFRTVHNS